MTNSLHIQIVDSPSKAPNYSRDCVDVRAANISWVIIVLNGLGSGKSTVDMQFQDLEGNTFVATLTGEMVKRLGAIVDGAEQRK